MARTRANPDRNENQVGGLELLHAAAAACPHGMMMEERGVVMYANPAYVQLAGFEFPEQLIGLPVAHLIVPHQEQKRNGKSDRIFDTIRFEFRHGRRNICLHVVRDVTDRRILESRLRESEKLEALGRLVGGVAHDFNNILTAILLYSDVLRERQGDGAREGAEIREAAQRGADLVRQLLTFARQQPGAPQVISLRKIIGEMHAVIEPLIGEDIDLLVALDAAHDCVRADPSQLQQLVLNLVINARDAMPQGGRIRIRTADAKFNTQEAKHLGIGAGNYVRLAVEDNGCGMPEEVRARIFEPFFTTKKHGTGTGLGMSMVYGIVTQAGGSVSVASRPGKGTRVTVLLPRTTSATHKDRVATGNVARGSETVLLAEDDSAVRASIAELLLARGYRVLQAHDGLHAVEIARAHKQAIHLLLSDFVMPRMNGVDAAATIRRSHPETKVLLMSGYPAKAATAAAPKALLLKPFSRTVLAQRVREALNEEERLPSRRAARSHSVARGMS